MTENAWLEKARALQPIVEKYRDEAERERHLSAPVFEAMRDAGLFGMLVSKDFGGANTSLEDAVRVIEEISRHDGATGWNATIGIGGALMADYLPEEHARTVFGGGPAAGSFGGTGQAIPVEGGYRVSGRWGFASGCHNAPWFAAGCPIIEDGAPRLLPSGAPDVQIMFMPAAECSILDTWTSVGLRGTGSHDIEAQDVFVPEGRHVSFLGMRQPAAERPSRAYATSFFANQGPLLSAVALGIAREALDAFKELATAKTPRGGSISLAQQHTVQAAFGRAEGLLRSARAYVYEVTREADACASDDKAQELTATMRLAGAQAAANAIEAVDLMYDWAGTSSVYAPNRIERCWRDVHVVSHHINIATVSFEMVGQYLLGGPLAQRR
jgi:alkylation response protein AidB-like acyl-CoA dehydrogenase